MSPIFRTSIGDVAEIMARLAGVGAAKPRGVYQRGAAILDGALKIGNSAEPMHPTLWSGAWIRSGSRRRPSGVSLPWLSKAFCGVCNGLRHVAFGSRSLKFGRLLLIVLKPRACRRGLFFS